MTTQAQKHNQEMTTYGINIGAKFIAADNQASETKRKLFLDCVKKEMSGDDFKLILDGFAAGISKSGMSESSIKVRKSEFNAVYKAVVKTSVSGDNLKKLEAFQGGYNEFIELSRDLMGRTDRQSGGKTREGKITDKQEEAILQKLEDGKPAQLVDIAESAIVALHKHEPTLAGFQTLLLIQASANQLAKNPSAEQFFIKIAEQVLAVVEPAIAQAQEASKKAKEVTSEVLEEKAA